MEYGIQNETLLHVLGCSIYWEGMGPKGELSLTEGERIVISRRIAKDLRESHEANGEEFFKELWVAVRDALGRCNWFQRYPNGNLIGPWGLWRQIYKQASRLAAQKIRNRAKSNPTQAGVAVQQVADEINRKIQQEALEMSGGKERFD